MHTTVSTELDIDDLSVRVQTSRLAGESRERPTFVLVHGIGMSHRYFRRLHDVLAETGTVHAVDLPGFGSNRRPDRDMPIEAQAAALASTLDSLAVVSAVVIGHSMGAQFAVELAVRRPDLVSHLVLIGPVTDTKRPTALQQAARLGLDTLRETPRVNAIVFSDYLRCGMPWYLNQLRPMLEYRIDERIALVGCPVLVLRGSRDPIALEDWCGTLASRASNGVAQSLDGGAHVVQESRTTQVADAVLSFVGHPSAIAQ